MARLHNRFWVAVTIVLCVVFAILFFPSVQQKYGFTLSLLMTLLGMLLIWANYFIRAYIFSRKTQDESEKSGIPPS
jgi:predicted transporter